MSENMTILDILNQAVEEMRAKHGREPVRYDLGCGKTPTPGFTGVDFYTDADINADLFGEWPFPSDSIDLLYSSHFVEHVRDWNAFFAEAYRTLKNGGLFVITTPYYLSVRAIQDPDHKQMISRERYWYLNREWREQQGLDHYEADVDFDYVAAYPVWNEKFAHIGGSANPDLVEYHLRHTPNAVDDLTVILRAKK